MTEKITLELTLKELQMIDKYVELNDDTQQLFDKIRNTYQKLDVIEIGGVKYQRIEEPTKPRSPLDEIVDRMVKEHQAQKLYNRLYDELSYDFDSCNDIVDLVEDWLPEPQSAAGSQNVDTELLVHGFNHCLEKMKGMLR